MTAKDAALTLFFLLFLSGCVSHEGASNETSLPPSDYFSQFSLDDLTGEMSSAFIGEGDQLLWSWSVTPDNSSRTVVFLHGYLDHSALSLDLFAHLNQKGIRIVAFDLPGHGLSGGRRAGLEDFEEYRRSLDRVMAHWKLEYGETVFIGHSTGGAMILDKLIEGVPIKGAVLAAPLIKYRWFGISSVMVTRIFRSDWTVPVSEKDCSSNGDFNRKKKNDPLKIEKMPLEWARAIVRWQKALPEGIVPCDVPLLVLQGEEDHVVYFEKNIPRLLSWFPRAEVNYYPGLMHHILNEADADGVYGDLERFISTY